MTLNDIRATRKKLHQDRSILLAEKRRSIYIGMQSLVGFSVIARFSVR